MPSLAPLIVLNVGAMIIFLCSAQRFHNFRPYIPVLAFVVILLALFTAFFCYRNLAGADELMSADGSLRLTAFSRITTYVGIIFGLILVLVSWNPDRRGVAAPTHQTHPQTPKNPPENFALLLVALSGLLLTAVANNLIVLFLALEMVSMPTYAMVALSRRHSQAKEAALKYFFLGALAAAILVYGFSFIYGLTGTIQLNQISDAVAHGDIMHPELFLLALVLVLIGLCFKIAAVPMHFYAADVYQGAACSVTALLAFLPKFAGFYVLFLIAGFIIQPLPENQAHIIAVLLWILAAATMITGNVLALVQRNVKRILAYSSVTHSGPVGLALPRRVRPGGPGLLYLCLCLIHLRRLRHLGPDGKKRRRSPATLRPQRPRPSTPRPRRRLDHLYLQPHGSAPDRRLHRKILRLLRPLRYHRIIPILDHRSVDHSLDKHPHSRRLLPKNHRRLLPLRR